MEHTYTARVASWVVPVRWVFITNTRKREKSERLYPVSEGMGYDVA